MIIVIYFQMLAILALVGFFIPWFICTPIPILGWELLAFDRRNISMILKKEIVFLKDCCLYYDKKLYGKENIE